MNKCALNLRVEPRQIERLDNLARQHGVNRSELMRMVLDNIQIIPRPSLGAVINVKDLNKQTAVGATVG